MRTWVILEDKAVKRRVLLHALLADHEVSTEDRIVPVLYGNEAWHYEPDQTGNAPLFVYPLWCANQNDLKGLFVENRNEWESIIDNQINIPKEKVDEYKKLDPLWRDLVIMLDIDIRFGEERKIDQYDYQEPNLEWPKFWRSLIADHMRRNVISVSSSLANPTFVSDAIDPKHTYGRVHANNSVSIDKSSWNNEAVVIVKKAKDHWRIANGVGLKLLYALVKAQSLTTPGHPKDDRTDWPADYFPLIDIINADEQPMQAFKALFWFDRGGSYDDTPDDSGVAFRWKHSSKRTLSLGTVCEILKLSQVDCQANRDPKVRIFLPTTPGGLFLYRFISFCSGELDADAEAVQLSVNEDSVVSLFVPLKYAWRFHNTFLLSGGGHGATDSLRRVLSCPKLDSTDLDRLPAASRALNLVESWENKNLKKWYKPDGSERSELVSIVCPRFEQDGLRLEWSNLA